MKVLLITLTLFMCFNCKKTDPPEPPVPANFPGTYQGRYFTTYVASGSTANESNKTTITKTNDPNVFQFTDDHLHSFKVKLTTINSSNAYEFTGMDAAGTLESTINGSLTNASFVYFGSGIIGGRQVNIQVAGSK